MGIDLARAERAGGEFQFRHMVQLVGAARNVDMFGLVPPLRNGQAREIQRHRHAFLVAGKIGHGGQVGRLAARLRGTSIDHSEYEDQGIGGYTFGKESDCRILRQILRGGFPVRVTDLQCRRRPWMRDCPGKPEAEVERARRSMLDANRRRAAIRDVRDERNMPARRPFFLRDERRRRPASIDAETRHQRVGNQKKNERDERLPIELLHIWRLQWNHCAHRRPDGT